MKMLRFFVAAFMVAASPMAAMAQQAILQGGPWTPGHAPMYVGAGSSQPILQDSGTAGGGTKGTGLSELGLIARGTGTPPYVGQGTGPFGTNFCDYDGPIDSINGYHYLCLSANGQNGMGIIAYGAAGTAAQQSLSFVVNGITYPFPGTGTGNVVGPLSSSIGHVATYANTNGTALSDLNLGGFVTGADASGVADARSRFLAADTAPFTVPPGIYRIASNMTISHNIAFLQGAQIVPDSGVVVTLNGVVTAPNNQQIFSGIGTVLTPQTPDVWTSWWGALANAATDAAPAFRAAMGSNRTVHSIPAAYLFCSTVSAGPYNAQYFPANVWPVSLVNITVDNSASVFTVCDASSFSAFFFFDRNTRATLIGGAYTGNHTGYGPTAEAPAIVTHNQLHSVFRNFLVTGNYGGLGAGIAGDYIAYTEYRDIVMNGVGQAMDVAFVFNSLVDHLVATGAGVDGTTTLPGAKGVAVIQDVPGAAGDNHLPFAVATNSGVTIENSAISNFNSCMYFGSGNTIKSLGNHLYNCPGNISGAQGIGIQITYEINSSEGFPVTDFLSDGDTIANNGSVTAGAGVSIDNNNIVNSDVMSNIKVVNATILNNATTGIRANGSGTTHLQNIDMTTGNIFSGSSQTLPLGGNIPPIQNPPPVPSSCNSGTVSANSTNASGTVTEGASSGGCVLSFAKKQANYPQLPTCFVWQIGTPATPASFGWSVASVTNGATLTITNATTDTRTYGYQCVGN